MGGLKETGRVSRDEIVTLNCKIKNGRKSDTGGAYANIDRNVETT